MMSKNVEEKKLVLEGKKDYEVARAAAEQSIKNKENLSLLAWYDTSRREGGPAEACSGEPVKCVDDYAMTHGADTKVVINDGEYLFYFSHTPEDANTLNREDALRAHEKLPSDYDNLQGG